MQVIPYSEAAAAEWNEFIRSSRNGTFLFDRGYMDYHADRFEDSSLIVRKDNGDLVAVLPASRSDSSVTSHGGLTYGGLITSEAVTAAMMKQILDGVARHLVESGVAQLVYKTIPYIYHRAPSEEDRYALFLAGAQLVRRDVLSVIDYRHRVQAQERRMRSVRKAYRAGVTVAESREYATFWTILARNLSDRYGVSPVHSVEEIELLASRFPDRIRLFTAERDGQTLAGAVVFVTNTVCHVQYNAASSEGKQIGALDVILDSLVDRFKDHVRYFDFGISTEKNGSYLNEGLVEYKEGFGSRTVVHDYYSLRIGDVR